MNVVYWVINPKIGRRMPLVFLTILQVIVYNKYVEIVYIETNLSLIKFNERFLLLKSKIFTSNNLKNLEVKFIK